MVVVPLLFLALVRCLIAVRPLAIALLGGRLLASGGTGLATLLHCLVLRILLRPVGLGGVLARRGT